MRILPVCAFVALWFSTAAVAAPATLSELSRYINSLGSATADFAQINSDGGRATGTLYLRRPGRARFEYDPPNEETLVVAGGGQLAIFDGRASGKPEQYPLRRTPLSLILARNVDLTRASMVTGLGEANGRTIVEAQDPDHPERGKIRLYFDEQPLRLAEWLITSETGERTRVILEPFNEAELSPFLFDISYITDQRQ